MTHRWLRWLLLALSLACLSASAAPGSRLPQDAYVWQQRWTPAVGRAVTESADLVRAWRVLAARSDAHGGLRPIQPDWDRLLATGRPVILVVRIDGRAEDWDSPSVRDAILARLHAAPLPIAGVEIDHDCATARLPAYAALLADLHASLPQQVALSITALPTWLESPAFDTLLPSVDEVVLQVHAVLSPRAGLFDPHLARRWIDALDRRTNRPFRVALPAYGTRVTWDADGRLLTVESERPLLAGGDAAQELVASPAAVASLLRDLHSDPPRHLAGVVWFRLPTTGDRRAWSPATWRAVAEGRRLDASTAAPLVIDADIPGLHHVLLANDGDLDVPLPGAVALPADCALADGINAYGLERAADHLVLRRREPGLLRAHARQPIGWARCDLTAETVHVAR